MADSNQDLEYRLDCNVVRPITSRPKGYKGYETSDQLVTYYATGLARTGPASKAHYLTCQLGGIRAHQVLNSPTRRSNFGEAQKCNSPCFTRSTR